MHGIRKQGGKLTQRKSIKDDDSDDDDMHVCLFHIVKCTLSLCGYFCRLKNDNDNDININIGVNNGNMFEQKFLSFSEQLSHNTQDAH